MSRILSIRCVCWAGRVTNIDIIEYISLFIIKLLFLKTYNNDNKTILSKSCTESNFLNKSRNIYTATGNSVDSVSIFRDIIILKDKTALEKGVVLIKYTPAFDVFYYYFDIDKIFNDYYLVLEPSWAGACDPSFLLYWRKSKIKNVIIQTLEPKDYRFVNSIGGNIVPINIGSSDWVDQDLFVNHSYSDKIYDLIMISNWGLHKKHKELFKSLAKIDMKLSVLLIGFPWDGRTKKDIEKDIKRYSLDHIRIDIMDSISTNEVAEMLLKSKIYLLLSKKEGGNKSIVEALTANVPAILYDKFIGGVQIYINKYTGILSSYKDLNNNIKYILDNYDSYSPRSWILENSGSKLSTIKLNNKLKEISIINGDKWICDIYEKINTPNLAYKSNISKNIDSYDVLLKYMKYNDANNDKS